MTKVVQKITLSPSRDIPFNKLVLSQSNVRRVKAGISIEQLAETDNTIHVVVGLLLPIWKRLPNESTRVYRFQTDAGERIIGRKVSAAWVANAFSADAPALSPDAAFAAVMEARAVLDLAEGLQLRRVRVMGACRIELSGFNDTMRDHQRPLGLLRAVQAAQRSAR
ncbi:hypothetical protein XI09_30400 [Bradyrhizobium sp. CCBAU 11386]|nr:hypothetical protein [Bradyrhizobium sp. CCBAU 11386]